MKTVYVLLALLVVWLVPVSVGAQEISPTKWTLKYCAAPVLAPATCTPVVAAIDLLRGTTLSEVQCNQVPIPAPTGTVTNPSIVEWNDPDVLPLGSKACVIGFPKPPSPLAPGDYAGVLQAVGTPTTGSSAWSAPSATFKIVVPLAPFTPTGVHVR